MSLANKMLSSKFGAFASESESVRPAISYLNTDLETHVSDCPMRPFEACVSLSKLDFHELYFCCGISIIFVHAIFLWLSIERNL